MKDTVGAVRIQTRIDQLQAGNPGDAKAVGDGVHELRCNFGPGYRVYFAQEGTILIILLCGGDKGSQVRDILKAKEFWADWKRRFK